MMSLHLKNCDIDLAKRRVRRGGDVVRLTAREAEALTYLAARSGDVVPRTELERDVWGLHERVQSNAVPVAISRLRQKIEENPSDPVHLLTVRGVGWTLVLPPRPVRPAGTRHNLPLSVDRFVGRADEIRWLEQGLERDVGPIAIVGPPGVGKRRLVHRVMRTAIESTEHLEVWQVQLQDDSDVLAQVSATLGVSEGHVLDALSDRQQVFLVLHAAGLSTQQQIAVKQLAHAGARVFLTLERTPTTLPTQVLHLGPLIEDDAVELLRVRAQSRRRDFSADEATLHELVRALQLPLLIELVAAHAHIMDGAALLERFRTAPRAPVLAARLDQVISALPETARHTAAQLACFHAPFALDAARWLIGPDADERVSELVDHSILSSHSTRYGVRFRLLNSLRSRLLAPLPSSAFTAWVGWCRHRAGSLHEQMYGPQHQQAVDILWSERDDLLAAREHADPEGHAQIVRVMVDVGAQVGASALTYQLSEEVERESVSEVTWLLHLVRRGNSRGHQGRAEEAIADAEASARHAHPDQLRAHIVLVRYLHLQGRAREALAQADQLLEHPDAVSWWRVSLLTFLVRCAVSVRQTDRARQWLDEATALVQAHHMARYSWVWGEAAELHTQLGHYRQARGLHEQSHRNACKHSEGEEVAVSALRWGLFEADQGGDAAGDLLTLATEHFRRVGVFPQALVGLTYQAMHEWDVQAQTRFTTESSAVGLATMAGHSLQTRLMWANLALLAYHRGDLPTAAHRAERAYVPDEPSGSIYVRFIHTIHGLVTGTAVPSQPTEAPLMAYGSRPHVWAIASQCVDFRLGSRDAPSVQAAIEDAGHHLDHALDLRLLCRGVQRELRAGNP